MGRKSHAQTLSIWANGQRVGTWRIPTRGAVELQYDRAWKDSPAGRPLSLSLPFGVDDAPLKGERVQNYFDNLLPDSDAIRKRIASRFGTGSVDPFDLLRAIGRDCVGAVQLLEEDETPGNVQGIDATALRDKDIEQLLEQTVSSATLGANVDEDDFRISLAGAQEKTALLRHKGKWLRPHGATPTTHILKLPLGLVGNRKIDLGTSVENEWLCLNILREFGLPVAQTDIHTFGRHKVLSVARFDRQLQLVSAASAGGFLPGPWRAAPRQVRGRRRPRRRAPRPDPAAIGECRSGPAHATHRADPVLDAGRARWPRQELQPAPARRRLVQADAAL
jgi:serine/threonine-protein kinase HipA